ncbi:SDR family oxidoreductase [Compostimonas suwonensis]|uniref:Short-subunit dehydrogenase n=1 Tax=Compostimonas suwonensis TaxID=1048394 RepID=A0A2M9BW33_9MICO|nr:SDR family oxidoreductase [Compostimonas suwonensis]PJJ62145.1 short-subunit dehydrogenase [Compostimonas suwonensis]
MVDIAGRTVIVTGGSRGLGKSFVEGLLERGAAKVYATARVPRPSTDERIVPLALEVTDRASIDRLVAQVQDATVLINNAGVAVSASFLDGDVDGIRREFETNFFGPVALTRALAPVIEANGGGAILNVHSALSWYAVGDSYSATKAALWSATNSTRLELAPRGIHVVGLHVGYVDTDMTSGVDAPKSQPADVARQGLDAIESGDFEVLADDTARTVKAGLSAGLTALYPQLAG